LANTPLHSKIATINYNGAAVTILIAGVIASLIGLVSYKQMKDRPNVSLWSDISNALKGELGSITGAPTTRCLHRF
jgi:dTMP kinase